MGRFLIIIEMMRYFLLIICVFTHKIGLGQKMTSQRIEAHMIKHIVIESNEVFKISIETKPQKHVNLKTQSEGEYFQNIGVVAKIEGEQLFINSKYPEILTSGFDKLSAHKVFAVEILLEVPEDIRVDIRSNVASVFGEGSYDGLNIELKTGQCKLINFQGNLLVNTYKGDIKIFTEPAKVDAISRQGEVFNQLNYTGENLLQLKTIEGNIYIAPSQ